MEKLSTYLPTRLTAPPTSSIRMKGLTESSFLISNTWITEGKKKKGDIFQYIDESLSSLILILDIAC